MQTSMRVSAANRDALARIAAQDLGGVSLDEALRIIVFEHETTTALTRLAEDADAAEDYRAEAQGLADVDVAVRDW